VVMYDYGNGEMMGSDCFSTGVYCFSKRRLGDGVMAMVVGSLWPRLGY